MVVSAIVKAKTVVLVIDGQCTCEACPMAVPHRTLPSRPHCLEVPTRRSSTWLNRTKSYFGGSLPKNSQDKHPEKKVVSQERGRRGEGKTWRETVLASSCHT